MSHSATSAQAPIFVQAMWRTGSTYVWKKFREQARYRAYYEPLHECYRWPREKVQSVCGAAERAALRHPEVEDYYCAEMPFTEHGGVEHFKKPLSYERYCLREDEPDAELHRYVGNLIEFAAQRGQRAVLQFNRGLLRAGWLERNFAPVQILVLRRPLNIWKSFARFPGLGFHAYVCTILGQNQEKTPLAHLPRWLKIPRLVSESFEEEFAFYQSFAAANRDRLYPSFFDFNLVATLHAAQHADCILDLDEIRVNPRVRQAAEARLAELGIEMSLDDCQLADYPADADEAEWAAYEQFSFEYLSATLPPELFLPEAKAAAHRPLLSDYSTQLMEIFTRRDATSHSPAENRNAESLQKHAVAINLYKNHQYQAAATLLGSALAQRQDGALWNDWAAAQAACGRRRLAELGFRQSLASELPCREAAGSLGLMLFEAGNFREALPLLIEAELSADQHTRPMLTRMVQQIREALGWCAPAPSRVAPRGLTIFLTGLSGAGKSTLAAALQQKLTGRAEQPVSLLDGDVVRQMLSSELGFSKQHRDINVRRIGFVSSLIARSGGIAICACIAPYDEARRQVRAMCKTEGNFLLVHVATPLEVCEQRDCKGLYARARAGELPGFTGLSDPYETPTDAEMSIDTSQMSVEEACEMILAVTDQRGYLADSVARQGDGILVGVA